MVIHPQSVVHSMVEMIDGSVIAEMAIPDMAIPVAFALAYPERLPLDHLRPLSLMDCATLTFEQPDLNRFPCLRLAYEALEGGRHDGVPVSMPRTRNWSRDSWRARCASLDIPRHIETVM